MQSPDSSLRWMIACFFVIKMTMFFKKNVHIIIATKLAGHINRYNGSYKGKNGSNPTFIFKMAGVSIPKRNKANSLYNTKVNFFFYGSRPNLVGIVTGVFVLKISNIVTFQDLRQPKFRIF